MDIFLLEINFYLFSNNKQNFVNINVANLMNKSEYF